MLPNFHIVFKIIKNGIRQFCVIIIFFSGTSCSNQFTGFANKTTDESLLASAQKKLRNGNYAGAISDCTYMSSGYSLHDDVAMICASAYAGNCGFTFMGMISSLDSYALAAPSEMLLEWFESQIATSTALQIADCHTAETIIQSQGVASARTSDENAFMILLALRTMALITDEVDDIDNNGASDGGLVCGGISDALAQDFASAFWELHKSLTVLQADPFYAPIFAVVDGLCTALNTLNPINNLCAAANPSGFDADQLDGARFIIKEGTVLGVGACANILACSCP